MSAFKTVVRRCDIKPNNSLQITEDDSGDIYVTIREARPWRCTEVYFAMSGSQSPKTREALKTLIRVIESEERQHE